MTATSGFGCAVQLSLVICDVARMYYAVLCGSPCRPHVNVEHTVQVVRLPPFQGHETLDIVPATADPIKTIIESWPPDEPIPTGVAHCMTIVPCDAYGNPGATSATFTVRMLYSGTNNVTPVTVTPAGAGVQGRLVATVIPKAVGNPALQVRNLALWQHGPYSPELRPPRLHRLFLSLATS